MTNNIPVLEVDESIAKATNSLAESMDDEINLIRVNPPKEQNEGMDVANKFLESVHFLDMDDKLIRSSENKSPTCGMEMWYDNNKVKFMFYTPSDELDQEYRQQLSGYYDGCEIAAQTSEEGMFLKTSTNENEAIAVTDLYLTKHYFSPIASPAADENELGDDPFQRITNEIDTKDDTRAMMQFLYKPAPYDWTELQHKTLETYAKRVQNKGGFKTRWFGFKIDEVDDPGIWETAASEMRSRINEPAYYVNVRLAIICRGPTQEQAENKAQSRARAVTNSIEHLYETKAEQKLVPRSYRVNEERNAKETLINMIERNATNMKQERRIHQMIWEELTSQTSTIILTAEELSGLVHLPSPDDVTSGAVSWTDQMVEGEVPPDVEEFNPVTPDEQEELEEIELDDGEEQKDETKDEKDPSDSRSALFDG
jgi:hypothetical protein